MKTRAENKRRPDPNPAAFTLLELLTVISIIGILAAVTLPNLKNFKPNVMAGATSQMLADVARARQLAISQRTTVYMIFVPPEFFKDPAYIQLAATNALEAAKGTSLLEKQMVGYTFASLRRVGDQPGAENPEYLSEWRSLPAGVIIAADKFGPTNITNPRVVTTDSKQLIEFHGFPRTRNNGIPVPFPTPAGAEINLPYIAFNYLGQLESGTDQFIPLALGNTGLRRDDSRKVQQTDVFPVEVPANNAVDTYNIIRIDWLTGRARVVRQEVR